MRQKGKKGVIDAHDHIIIPAEFDDILDVPFGLMTTRESRYGLYSHNGKLLFPAVYDGFYNPYTNKGLINVEDSVNRHLYQIGNDTTFVKLITYAKDTYRLNPLEYPYFKPVKKDEILFCLYNIAQDHIEKVYRSDTTQVWEDITQDKKLRVDIDQYFDNANLEAPQSE